MQKKVEEQEVLLLEALMMVAMTQVTVLIQTQDLEVIFLLRKVGLYLDEELQRLKRSKVD